MIELCDVNKFYRTRKGRRQILDSVSLSIARGEKLGILGRNGAGKSTLIRIISGAEQPTDGLVRRSMSASWPLAYTGAFQSALSGLDNVRFICRIYGVPVEERVAFIQEFSDLGAYLYEPINTYSAGMRARLAFAVSMSIEFDCFLIDEVISVGDSRFHERCRVELFEKRADRALIIVSHDAAYVRAHCDRAAVLIQGKLHNFDSTDEAFEFYDKSVA
ncbi:ABC transporter ATP-binding protein [Sphingomonas sp. 10B4]|uniref:ABC transporter ATP-binding protein n=1 Tax=Sphingomonas sp. 10B4 TaxID=3048575 RepID=UPI002AB41CC6|nr:ABC transporter ATP-binding protein [Sphingomonas sp. 10B4]MDY7523914.1 ABC transporter ATP-binding protein [Sphingomonas sp. 10B4]MEB0284248.1 ABC transporter ATP-binding protein [Sphingomonas sp. 10B4]